MVSNSALFDMNITQSSNHSINKILIVDDDQDIADMLQDFFSIEGYECKKMTSSLRALEIFDSDLDLLVTDLLMPEMNGVDLIKNIRKRVDGKQIKIIVMSGNAIFLKQDEINELRINIVLSKPTDLFKLSKIIKGL